MSFKRFDSFWNINPSDPAHTCIAITSEETRCQATIRSPKTLDSTDLSNAMYRGGLFILVHAFAKGNLCTIHRDAYDVHLEICEWCFDCGEWLKTMELSSPREDSIQRKQLSARNDNDTAIQAHAPRKVHGTTPSQYIPFRFSPKLTAERLLRAPLKQRDTEPGQLYMFSKLSSPGYVKIGTTVNKFSRRVSEIKRICGYHPNVLHVVINVPYARRVEQLIFKELHEYRRHETNCDCGVVHGEWFKVDAELAKDAISKWCSWFQKINCYDTSGGFSEANIRLLDKLSLRHGSLTARILLRNIHRFRTRPHSS